MEVRGQHHVPDALAPGKRPNIHRTRGSLGLRPCLYECKKEKNISSQPGLEPRTIQPVANRYTLSKT